MMENLEKRPFDFPLHVQDSLLSLAVEDDEIIHHVSLLINPSNFASEEARTVFTLIRDFYLKYKCAPGEHFPDIAETHLQTLSGSKRELLNDYLHRVYSYESNKQYVLDQLDEFVKYTKTTKGIIEAAQLVSQGKYLEARQIILDSFDTGMAGLGSSINLCIDMDKRPKYNDKILISTGITGLDGMIDGFHRRSLVVWLASTNVGKCLKIGTKIIMYNGSLRAVEDIKVGDKVMGPDSKPRTVLNTNRGIGNLYKVKQTQAMDYIVNENHILAIRKARWKRSEQNKVLNIPLKTFMEMQNCTSNKNTGYGSKRHFRGYKAEMIHFPEKIVTIDPYFLGLWLGDGCKSTVSISNPEPEIEQFCEKYAKELNGSLTSVPYKNKNCKYLNIVVAKGIKGGGVNGRKREYPLVDQFIKYNLRRNKHIPNDFLINSEENRLQLLAGLIDSDGYFFQNCYFITQKDDNLAKQIKFLADSLGFKTSARRGRKDCKFGICEYHNEYTRISIMGNIWKIPCKVERKKAKPVKKKDFLSSLIKIEPYGVGEYAGFTLDGDHLFLLEDGTVTHNSFACVHCSIEGLKQGLNVLFYTLELEPEWVAVRHEMGLCGMGTREKITQIFPEGTSHNVKVLSQHDAERRRVLKSFQDRGGEIQILGMPYTGLTVSNIESDLEILLAKRHFVPDMIIVDYADLMLPETGYTEWRHQLAEIYKGLRRIAVTRNCLFLTASQSNRASMGLKVVSLQHFAEDIQKANIADMVLSLCQTPEEANSGRMRIFCCKNRNGPKGFQILNYYNYDIGQFSLQSSLCSFTDD